MSKSHSNLATNALDASDACDGERQANISHRYQVVLQQLGDTSKFTREWFQLKEEEVELRSRLNRDSSGCTALVPDSDRSADEQAASSEHRGDIYIYTGDGGGANTGTGIISPDIPDSSNEKEIVGAPAIAGHLTSPPTDNLCFQSFESKAKHTERKDAASLFEVLGNAKDDDPPIPFSGHCYNFEDGSASEKIAAETLADEEGAPVPYVPSANNNVSGTQNLSRAKVAKWAKHEQSASRQVERGAFPRPALLPVAVPDHTNQDLSLPNQEILQQSSVFQTAVNVNYGLLSSPPITHETSNLPTAVTDGLSHSSPYESVHREDEKEDVIVIPEAFMVEENAPEEVHIAEVAELVEPDPSRVSLRKRHAYLFLVCVAAALVLAVVLAVMFTSRNNMGSISESTGSNQPNNRSFSPSSQPSVVSFSPQPSISVRYEIEVNVLQRNATFDGNRGLALDWITNTDDLQLQVSDSNLYQRYILALLSFEFNISEWWLSASSECEWSGVSCGNNGTVIKLELDSVNLIGTIPPEISGLRYLKIMSLGFNYLHGTLPSELGKLTSLTYLYVGNNYLKGTLPSELGDLVKLTFLKFEFNEFTGTIPSDLRHLNALTTLSVAQNQFHGTFPSWFEESFTLIDHLHVDNNQFTGTLPSEIGTLTTLVYLDVNSNNFTGNIPSEIGELTLLTHLSVHHNGFVGTLPTEIGELKLLTRLEVQENSFVGTLPAEMGKLISLSYLDIGRNDLSGTLPSELGNIKELTHLNFEFNKFTGAIPSDLRYLNALTKFSVAQNQFRGTFPSWIVESFTLIDHLHLDYNQFTGTLPSEIGTMTTLVHLDLHSNKFTGSIPSEIGNLRSLTYLRVGWSNFQGTLPTEIGRLTLLTVLDASHLSLRGSIPSTIGGMVSMTELTLNQNQFTGAIPSEIGNMVQLTKLFLYENQLTGIIPSEIGFLDQLTELWLYSNHLSGSLPSEIGYLTSLTAFSVGPNNLNGTVPTEFGNLSEVEHLSLGGNNFTGTIPSEIEQLSKLTELLLQENLFTGPFPPNLETCSTGMTNFCFYGNQFTGDFPSECCSI
ncbi:hypothetical protein ACHAW6_012773 [Cyclotella cf. meneghiniana]